MPPERFGIAPWQHARMGAARYSPFAADVKLRSRLPVAAAAAAGNLPLAEGPVDIEFTTNSLGFRSTPGLEHKPPRILVMAGSSFGYGYALSDEDTLSAVLQRELQTPVFNGSRFFTDPDGLIQLDRLLGRLPAKPQAVVYVYLEQQDLYLRRDDNPYPDNEQPPGQSLRTLGYNTIGPPLYREIEESVLTHKRTLGTWFRVSPLQITVSRWQKALANDRFLPNTHRDNVTVLHLTNGKRILFEHYEWRRAIRRRNPERTTGTANYLAWMRDRLNDRGLRMYVVMTPDKVNVYREWLRGPAPSMQSLHNSGNAGYMADLHAALTARGVMALDGLAVLRRTAAADVADGHLTYYLDDAHWNATGVDRIGRAAAQMMSSDALRPVFSTSRE